MTSEEMVSKPEYYLYKVFNDPVHGHIALHPLCVMIIDTPEFQRLRFIKKLPAVYFVYPGASHNIFEHSLGVCYLADRLVRKLVEQQPDLYIEETDIVCVQIAGLCRHLGHGPFSDLFEESFIPRVCPGTKWTHEQASVEMLDRLIKVHKLEQQFRKYGITEDKIGFIKELMLSNTIEDDTWENKGIDVKKRYLYEIVSNKKNGIDVTTMDSLARDCFMLGFRSNFDHERCMKNARVIKCSDEHRRLCFRDKEKRELDEMFFIQAKLQDRAYHHKIAIVQALVEANNSFNILLNTRIEEASVEDNNSSNIELNERIDEASVEDNNSSNIELNKRPPVKISDAITDMDILSQLTDDIFNRILFSKEAELEKSRKILRDLLCRQLYVFVTEKQPGITLDEGFIKTTLPEQIHRRIPDLAKGDIVIQSSRVRFGPNLSVTVENVYFYSKKTPDNADPMKQTRELPKSFQEDIVRIFLKKGDENLKKKVNDEVDRIFDTLNGQDRSNSDQTEGSHSGAEGTSEAAQQMEAESFEAKEMPRKKRKLDED